MFFNIVITILSNTAYGLSNNEKTSLKRYKKMRAFERQVTNNGT